MADTKISALTELAATPTSGDLLTIIDDPGGTPASKKITVDNLVAFQDARTATFTNKTIALGNNTVSGTTAQFNTALSDGSFATQAGTETLTNKTIDSASNTLTLDLGEGTLTGTTAEFNTALQDGSFATLAGTETLTNKTLGASTLSGTMSAADNIIDQPKLQDVSETVNAIGAIGGGTQDINLESGNVVTATVDTSTTTFTFSNPPATGSAGSFTLILTNGGSQTVNWPASVDWAGGTAPTLTTSGVDVLTFLTVDGGTIWYGFAAGLDMQ